MEQARYWMWSKPTERFYGDSWEEQAFAVDSAAGSLGGCVWPPRSYTCSVCRREFRSAQALGGHMNVHRRDRARFKQSQSPVDHEQHILRNNLSNISAPLNLQYPIQVSNPSPKSQSSQFRVVEKSSLPIISSVEGLQANSSIIPIPSRSQFVGSNNFSHILDLTSEVTNEKLLGFRNSGANEEFEKADLSISVNLTMRRKRSSSCEGEKVKNINCKRKKVESSSLSSFTKSTSSDRFHVQLDVLELSSSYIEELDLELNLGIGQKKGK